MAAPFDELLDEVQKSNKMRKSDLTVESAPTHEASSRGQHQRESMQQNQRPSLPKRGRSYCCCCSAIFLFCLALLGTVHLFVVHFIHQGTVDLFVHFTNSNQTIEESAAETEAPEETLSSAVINSQPFLTKRSAPVPQGKAGVPTSQEQELLLAQQEQSDDLMALITSRNITAPDEFSNPLSSPYKALQWMVLYDAITAQVSSDDMATVHLLERYALIVFYFATHPHAMVSDSSTQDNTVMDWIHYDVHVKQHVCHWQGIGCGHLHRVVMLNLTNQQLAGTLPLELKALQHLNKLDLGHNQIGGMLPWEYGSWMKLTYLSLADNKLEGTVPPSWEQLNLQVLDLSQNDNQESYNNQH